MSEQEQTLEQVSLERFREHVDAWLAALDDEHADEDDEERS